MCFDTVVIFHWYVVYSFAIFLSYVAGCHCNVLHDTNTSYISTFNLRHLSSKLVIQTHYLPERAAAQRWSNRVDSGTNQGVVPAGG